MKKNIITWGCLLFFTVFGCLTLSGQAEAATTKLEVNNTYNQYDVTGDQVADKLNIQASYRNYFYSNTEIYVNGNKVYTDPANAYFIDLQLITLENEAPFLFYYASGENGDGTAQILQYQNEEFVPVFDALELAGSFSGHFNAEIVQVDGNKVTLSLNMMSWSLGAGVRANVIYEYKDNTLQRTSKTAQIVKGPSTEQGYCTANRKIKVYKKAGSKKEKIYTIKENQKVILKKLWMNKGKMWIQVQNQKGESGWIPASKKPLEDGPGIFKEVFYAG